MCKKLSFIGDPEECFICKSTYSLETHHLLNGPYKKASEKYGLLIKVCTNCHTMAPNAIHRDSKVMKKLKQLAQTHFEKTHAREEFIKEFGQNYFI